MRTLAPGTQNFLRHYARAWSIGRQFLPGGWVGRLSGMERFELGRLGIGHPGFGRLKCGCSGFARCVYGLSGFGRLGPGHLGLGFEDL